MVSLMIASSGLAQGISPIRVNKITVTPATFKAGDRLKITIEIENTASVTYGCVGDRWFHAYVGVYKNTPFNTTNRIWNTEVRLTTPLRAGEKRGVRFLSDWDVPKIETDKFIFLAWGPVCAPDEFGMQTQKTYIRSCSYSSPKITGLKRTRFNVKKLGAIPIKKVIKKK